MHASKTYKGIIYRVFDSNAADKVVVLITEDGSRLACLAKGVKKENSKKAYSIDLGNFLEIKVVEGYNVPLITEVKLLNEFSHWKDTYQKLTLLQLFCEVVDKFCFEENHDPDLFKIFYNILNTKNDRSIFLAAIFTLQILYTTGNLPMLNESMVSTERISNGSFYSSRDFVGYVSDSDLSKTSNYTKKISDRIYKTERFIIKSGLRNAIRVVLSLQEELDMLNLHLDWIEVVVEKSLKSRKLIKFEN